MTMRNHGTDSGALTVVDGTAEHRRQGPRQASAERSADWDAPGSLHAYRADAAFLAQLLAVRTHAPAQRAKRRAAPEVGAAAYRSGLGLLASAPAPRGTPGIKA